jgi:steroid delta-isomerase-like uncharacterized protein
MSEQNKTVLRRCVEEIWNKGNLMAMEEFYTHATIHVDPVLPETRGIEAVKQIVTMVHMAFPDIHYSLDDLIAEGDKVVFRWTIRGTHKGGFLGVAATGKQVEASGTSTCRFAGGRIVEGWANWDAFGMMQQLGVVTDPAVAEANKAVVRRYLEEIANRGDLALVDELFSADSIFHGPNLPEIRGREAKKQFLVLLRGAFPDFHLTINGLIAEGNNVALRWSESGTHRGEWWGIAPTCKKLSWSGTTAFQIADGMITDEFLEWDALGFMQQLGVVPPLSQPAGTDHAFEAAKVAYTGYGWLLQEMAKELGWDRTIAIYAGIGDKAGQWLGGMVLARSGGQKPDVACLSAVLAHTYRGMGIECETKPSNGGMTIRIERCPIYEGLAASGIDHATIQKLCEGEASRRSGQLHGLVPELMDKVTFRENPSENCVEEFVLAK